MCYGKKKDKIKFVFRSLFRGVINLRTLVVIGWPIKFLVYVFFVKSF